MTPIEPTGPTPDHHQYAFDGDTRAPAQARDHVREALGSWQVPEDTVEAAVLLVSELTTNAVKHTRSPRIGLELLRREGEVEMAVQDSGPRPVAPLRTILTQAGDTWDENGRGLGIVHRLASRWGTAEAGTGLKVWAAIDTDGTR
ncbi:ATP-binding protein [Streptomyces sp. NPDC091383]|uniref:ATP-binding protein n=1 Tax=Streptomyces sp. NPDC091383 TaxID=3365996 RepID=UPI0038270240